MRRSSSIRTSAITNSPSSITTSDSRILRNVSFRRHSRSIRPARSWQMTLSRGTAFCTALTSSSPHLRKYFPEERESPFYHMMKGDLEAARRQMDALAAKNAGRYDELLTSYLLALGGERKRSEEFLAKTISESALSPRANNYHHVTYDIACIYAINGNGPEAMKWLRETAKRGFRSHTLFARDPFLDKIRRLTHVRAVHGRNESRIRAASN